MIDASRSSGISIRRILAILLALQALAGLLIIVDAVYVFTFGGWPLYEHGKFSHGLFNRLLGIAVLGHAAIFYSCGLRLRWPRWGILPLHVLSLIVVLLGSVLIFGSAWKYGFSTGNAVGLLFALGVSLGGAWLGTSPRSERR